MEPSPRGLKFVPAVLLPEFGWKHKKAGKKYSEDEKSFRQTINANAYSNRGFTVKPKKCNLIVKIFYNQLNLILIYYLKVNLYFHLIGESKLLL